jgi:hypothetical protein
MGPESLDQLGLLSYAFPLVDPEDNLKNVSALKLRTIMNLRVGRSGLKPAPPTLKGNIVHLTSDLFSMIVRAGFPPEFSQCRDEIPG